jgi:DNA-directed RNA polymerase subunit H (RpoH/RPB5)
MSSTEIFNARKIVLYFMKEQGYDINEYINCSMKELNMMIISDQLDMFLKTAAPIVKPTPAEMIDTVAPLTIHKTYIRFLLTPGRLNMKQIQDMIDDLYEITETLTKKDTLYIIITGEPSESLINNIRQIWENDGIYIVVESIKRLQYNILIHSTVPTHTIMNPVQVEEMMLKYGVTSTSLLPQISRFDPVARALCMRPAQICHILRSSKTAILTPYYRICVNQQHK